MSWTKLVRTVEPEVLPVTVSQLKQWLREDLDDQDSLIETLIQDAVDYIEGPDGIGVAMSPQTWEMSLDAFPHVIRIPLSPVMSVKSITYTDEEGLPQEVTDFQADTVSKPARLMPEHGKRWPQTQRSLNAVVVEFKAGYDRVPGDLLRAVALLVAHWYEHREAVVVGSIATETPFAVESILNKYRVGRFG